MIVAAGFSCMFGFGLCLTLLQAVGRLPQLGAPMVVDWIGCACLGAASVWAVLRERAK